MVINSSFIVFGGGVRRGCYPRVSNGLSARKLSPATISNPYYKNHQAEAFIRISVLYNYR